MALYYREETYLKILSERARTVKELSKQLFISEPTVRRDIARLKKKNLVVCNHGNVSLSVSMPDGRVPAFIRDYENVAAKEIMAKKAVEYIRDGDVVMLDASTSAYALIPHLQSLKHLLVITSGAKTSIALSVAGIKNICTGGESIPESFSFIGHDAERTLKNYNADVAIFSCRGLSEDGVATDNSIYENEIRKIMLQKAKRKILLCDESKRGKTYLHTLCHIDELDAVISEKE